MQIDISASNDAFMEQLNPNNNNGTNSSVRVGEDNDSSKKYRALMKFDLSGIPEDATIISAELILYRWMENSDYSRTMRIFRVKRSWVESEVTWNEYSSGNSWEVAGCGGSNDCESSDIGSLSIDASTLGYFEFDLDASKIQEMLTNGSFQNNGFLFKNDTELNDSSRFYNSDLTGDLPKCPKLVIEYETPNPEPDPVGIKLSVVDSDILFFKTSVRLRAQRRITFLKTKKKGKT